MIKSCLICLLGLSAVAFSAPSEQVLVRVARAASPQYGYGGYGGYGHYPGGYGGGGYGGGHYHNSGLLEHVIDHQYHDVERELAHTHYFHRDPYREHQLIHQLGHLQHDLDDLHRFGHLH